MYDSISGELARVGVDHVSVVCGGIGFRLHVPPSYVTRLAPKAGQDVKFFTHLHVTESDHKLFAFDSEQERDLFKLLQSVSGVGPSLALALLSGPGVAALVRALGESDLAVLTRIRGVGRKTAERLCLELKDKVADFAAVGVVEASPPQRVEQLAAALTALGYTRSDARRLADSVITRQPTEHDLEVLLKTALASSA